MSKPVREISIHPKKSLKPLNIMDEPIPASFEAPILQTSPTPRISIRSRMKQFMSNLKKEFKKFNDWILSSVSEKTKKKISEKTRALKERISKIYKTTIPTEVENAFKGKVKTFRIERASTMDYKTFLQLNKMSTVTSSVASGGAGGAAAPPLFNSAWSVGTFTIFVGTFGFVKNIKKVDLK